MNLFLYFLFFCLASLIGSLVAAFTMAQIIAITSVGIPLAVRLKNKGVIDSNAPLYKYVVSVVILSAIMILCLGIVLVFFPNYLVGFLFGAAIVSFQQKNARRLDQTLPDFLQTNAQYFTQDPKTFEEYEVQDYFNISTIDGLEPNEVFFKIFGEVVSNTFYFGAVIGVILLLGSFSWWVGIVAAGLYALLVIPTLIQAIISVILIVVGWLAFIYSKITGEYASPKEHAWLTLSAFVRLIEIVVDLLFVFMLYQSFFPNRPLF